MRRILAPAAALMLAAACTVPSSPAPALPTASPAATAPVLVPASPGHAPLSSATVAPATPAATATPTATPRPVVRRETAQSIRVRAEASQPDVRPWLPPQAAYEINGVPGQHILVMGAREATTVRAVFARGQDLGLQSHAFSLIGDSTIGAPYFLTRFETAPYHLGTYGGLQPVIEHFAGSFKRQGAALRAGLHSWSLFDPAWAGAGCAAGEGPVACEIRLHRPAFAILRVGSNDGSARDLYEANIRRAVDYALDQGVIPVLSTKADRKEGSDTNNEVVRALAAEYALPLWDWDAVAGTLPNRGIDPDDPYGGVHLLSFPEQDFRLDYAFERGQAMQNLSALIVLDALWRTVDPPAR